MHDKAMAVVDTAVKAATAYGREDLALRLEGTRRTLSDPSVRVMVVGEFKQGKSSLVNAMLNAPVCPVDDDVATSVPTLVRYADEPRAGLVRPDDRHRQPRTIADGDGGLDQHGNVEPIDFQSVPVYASELGNPGNERGLLAVEIGLPRTVLSNGLVVVDTPGVGGLGSPHTAATIAALPSADVVLFISDASQELTRAEFHFLQTAQQVCRSCAFVLTKHDFYPDWQRIRNLNAEHLEALPESIPILTASATLRHKAIESNDKALNHESGYPQLIEFVTGKVAEVSAGVVASAATDMRSVVGQLRSTFDGEKQVLEDPRVVAAVMAEFENARERTTALRDQAARWQVSLNDGVADLTADFDHRLRARLRQTSAEADAALDEQQPGQIWDQFEQWLRRRVSHDLAQTYVELVNRTQDLSLRVADHFDDDQGPLAVHLDASGVLSTAEGIDPRTRIEPLKIGTVGKAMTAMRGSYGGLLMFGMMAQMAGLAMLNPATAAVGLLMGRKAVKDERERRLTLERQQARVTARQFIDDAGFEIGKEMKDSLRLLHRQLRDHYQTRAEELNRSIATSMAAAKEAMNADKSQRDARLGDVNAELGRLAQLAGRIDALVGPGSEERKTDG
ncbi:MAG: dynamin family protein [Acidimicrobiales bacterium]